MTNQPPRTIEEIQRLRDLHCHRGRRGPIVSDHMAVERMRAKLAKMAPRHRVIVQAGPITERTATELSESIAVIVRDHAVIRRFRSGIAIESEKTISRDLVPQCQGIVTELVKLLDRRCHYCRSSSVRIEHSEQPPGWQMVCTGCGKSLRRPKSVS